MKIGFKIYSYCYNVKMFSRVKYAKMAGITFSTGYYEKVLILKTFI